MYKLKPGLKVELAGEIAALADYVPTRWEGVKDALALFTEVAHAAREAMVGWYDSYLLGEAIRQLEKERQVALAPFSTRLPERLQSVVKYYDHLSGYLFHLSLVGSRLSEVMQRDWNFERTTNQHYVGWKQQFPWLKDARPVGWSACFTKGYVDFAGQAEHDKTGDCAAFKGANTAGAGSFEFPVRIALPYVLYDEKCQGRKAPSVLVSAAFGHFMGILVHNQTIELIEALRELMGQRHESDMLFDLNLTSSHPALSVLLDWVRENALADANEWGSRARWDAQVKQVTDPPVVTFSEEELVLRRKAVMEEMLVELKTRDTQAEQDARRATEHRFHQSLLKRARQA